MTEPRAGNVELHIEAQYHRIRHLAEGETVARTIDINGGGVMLDVDAEGRPLGIEILGDMTLDNACWLIVAASRW